MRLNGIQCRSIGFGGIYWGWTWDVTNQEYEDGMMRTYAPISQFAIEAMDHEKLDDLPILNGYFPWPKCTQSLSPTCGCT